MINRRNPLEKRVKKNSIKVSLKYKEEIHNKEEIITKKKNRRKKNKATNKRVR